MKRKFNVEFWFMFIYFRHVLNCLSCQINILFFCYVFLMVVLQKMFDAAMFVQTFF